MKSENELITEIQNEKSRCENEIRKIDMEIARLNGKREELSDRATMLRGFLN